ncbi:uncharacterized protein [Aegilops tauschii subsp. strangulata]|uniref:uncharacterized protein n=1 Tax=Aegilops tauschii subsp. strangulata TaxID=200361 RepID=UPI00098A322E|nr:uncharacterized protein LOC109739697 [Aegilops tauschii subsp. strangulata]
MPRHVFNRIREGVVAYDDYFVRKEDDLGKVGFSSYQKCTTAIRKLAYRILGDLIGDYVRMSESTCLEFMYGFCKAVVAVFGPTYLGEPTAADTTRLLVINADRGFLGMLGSINLFKRLAEGNCLEVNVETNGYHYSKGYCLANGIYPQWTTLVKTIPNPIGEKRQRFAQAQESARDVERAFGILQSR